MSLQVVNTSILNEEIRRKDNVVVRGKRDTTFGQRKKQAKKPTKERKVSCQVQVYRGKITCFYCGNLDTSRMTVNTLRKTKVLQTMLNPARFMRRRALESWLQVKKSFCSFASKRV